VRDATHRHDLDQVLSQFLDGPLREHVHVASARNGILVLAADTPVWGHRIRYLAPAMLEHLRRQEPKLTDVRIIVRPAREEPEPEPRAPRTPVSHAAGSFLESVADDCDNPGLARALRRLARRSRRTESPRR
jgi:hypothetical protein